MRDRGWVFISHSTHERDEAKVLRSALRDVGVTCWMAPDDIPPGDHYAAAIVFAIEVSSTLIVLVTENSVRSSEVAKEVELANRFGVRVIPVVVGDCELEGDLKYHLRASDSSGAENNALPSSLLDSHHGVA